VVKDAAYVTIKGTGISDVKQDATGKVVVNALGLSGAAEVRTSASSSYLLKSF